MGDLGFWVLGLGFWVWGLRLGFKGCGFLELTFSSVPGNVPSVIPAKDDEVSFADFQPCCFVVYLIFIL